MIKVTLYNPSQSPITDFPIDEAEFNEAGEMKVDPQGNYVKTGHTLVWNLACGESKAFPKYVADYLKQIYEFLEVVEDTPTTEINLVNTPPKPKMAGNFSCRHCGKDFTGAKALGLHIASRHPEQL